MDHKRDCTVCGAQLIYMNEATERECFFCKSRFSSNTLCENGHFVCDLCHGLSAKGFIKRYTISSEEKDPIQIALTLMNDKRVKMHGPEHHFLVPAALLCSYFNLKHDTEKKKKAITEAEKRSKNVLGGFCGFYGTCGAAMGVGIFISIITGANPLSKTEWKLSNLATSKSLLSIALNGGPRCCKRNTLLAIIEATEFVKENLDVEIKTDVDVECMFSPQNSECIKGSCPFYER